MVVPVENSQAAETGDSVSVFAWLDAGNDVNDSGTNRGTLIHAIASNNITAPGVALARELVARGADVNIRLHEMSAFEMAILCTLPTLAITPILVDFVSLLIDARLTLKESDQHDPLAWAFCRFHRSPHHTMLRVVSALIRAGAPIDLLTRDPDLAGNIAEGGSVLGNSSAETVLRGLEQEKPELAQNANWIACKKLVDDIRASGGNWTAYRRQARKDALRVRSLVVRGRARSRRTRKADPIVDRVFRLPNELAWHVLGFWRATGAMGEVI